MNPNSLRSIFISLSLIAFAACQSEGITLYSQIAKEGLTTAAVHFKLPEDALLTTPQNIFIRLRNDNAYPYANIFLLGTIKTGNRILLQDTLEYAMTTPDGQWLGTGFTEVKESKLWWKEGFVFPSDRPITLAISQAMRNNGEEQGVNALKGILSVGITVEPQQQ